MKLTTDSTWMVTGFSPEIGQAYRQKLLTIGLLPGSLFRLIRVAPLGDPIHIVTRRTNIVLRKKDFNLLQVSAIS
ncbi:ferrous iron transporter A [Salmonella enterica]|nr:ferrous iron transporter A [Salmonella enterica]